MRALSQMAPSQSDSLLSLEPVRPDFTLEARILREGHMPVAGVDEAGRGPLAGPVVAAAVILDPDRIPEGIDDSKRLSATEREALYSTIFDTALAICVASICSSSIDGTNILKASLEAMRRAVEGLCQRPRYALIDGRDPPPGLFCPCQPVIRGDQRSQSIAAAGIVAKVTRDRMMVRAGNVTPHYGFESHVGYATARHRSAISLHGPITRLHRMTFAPFRTAENSAAEMIEELPNLNPIMDAKKLGEAPIPAEGSDGRNAK